MSEDRARAERLLSGDEDRPGIRPAVNFADHSYPAFSAKQMVDFALAFASEREAIGRAAGREEERRRCAGIADGLTRIAESAKHHVDPLPCDTNEAWRRVQDGAIDIATAIRSPLPVDGGKDGA